MKINLPQKKYNLYFRLVEVSDAEFILSLRNDKNLSKFISKTSKDINEQIEWIKRYKEREKLFNEFYIMCLSKNRKTKFGLNRIYNISENSFEIGSWLFKPDKSNNNSSILSDLFCRSLMFENENFIKCVFQVRKKNKSVLRYHKMFNPKLINEDILNKYFELSRRNFEIKKNNLLKIMGYD